jgi:hypothetical protein
MHSIQGDSGPHSQYSQESQTPPAIIQSLEVA